MDKRGIGDRLRLYSGLVLLFYVVGHLLNHALGLVSLEAMEAATAITIEPWRTAPGTVLLGGAALVHVATGLWSLYARRSLRLPAWQLAQTALGLLIPVLLVGHVLGTRMLVEVFDVDQSYALELFFLWAAYPAFGITQTITLLVVWVHACVGLHMWLRLKPWYAAEQRLAFALAILIPAAALAGFVAAGMRVRALAADQEWLETLFTTARVSPDMVPWVVDWTFVGQVGFLALFAALFLGRAARALWRARSSRPRLSYLDHDAIRIAPGMTVLEALRAAGVPHASVCGGRGRCSTCRVHIDAGGATLSPASGVEERVLRRISAPASVRLACQIRPTADLRVTPLLPATAGADDSFQRASHMRSDERAITVLFADLRGFTRLAESRLPYDVVFVLNRYRADMARAIEEAGGVVNEFVGDGIMALFGLDGPIDEGCRQAVRAAHLMARNLVQLNQALATDLDEPLRMGMGIHVGPVIVGEMGYRGLKGITAVGDVVNTASRLEGKTKDFRVQLVVSEDVLTRAGIDPRDGARHEVTVRGRVEPMHIRAIENA